MSTIDKQLYSLAALYQSCNAISRIAWEGQYDEKEFLPLIKSILDVEETVVEPETVSIEPPPPVLDIVTWPFELDAMVTLFPATK